MQEKANNIWGICFSFFLQNKIYSTDAFKQWILNKKKITYSFFFLCLVNLLLLWLSSFFYSLFLSNHLNIMINFSVFFLFRKKIEHKRPLSYRSDFFLIFSICLRMIFETTCLRNDVLVRSLTQFVVSLLLSLRFNDNEKKRRRRWRRRCVNHQLKDMYMYTYADVILITIKKEKCLTTSVFRKTLTMYYFHVYFFALILMKRPFSFFFSFSEQIIDWK